MMDKNNDTLTNKAALWALAFAFGSIAYSYLSGVLSGSTTGLVIALVLWCLKFTGLNYLMFFVMKRAAFAGQGVSLREIRKMGNLISLFSAILVAIWTYIDFSFISAERIQSAYQVMMTQKGLDSNTLEALAYLMGNLPLIGTIWQLFYCCIYGICLSSICSLILMKRIYFDKQNPSDKI